MGYNYISPAENDHSLRDCKSDSFSTRFQGGYKELALSQELPGQ